MWTVSESLFLAQCEPFHLFIFLYSFEVLWLTALPWTCRETLSPVVQLVETEMRGHVLFVIPRCLIFPLCNIMVDSGMFLVFLEF